MIADTLILLAEKSLDNLLSEIGVDISPRDLAYPTSDKKFIRLAGTNDTVEVKDQSISFRVGLSITTSARIGSNSLQNEYVPYLEIIDIQERAVIHLVTNQLLITNLRSVLPSTIFIRGRFETSFIDLTPAPTLDNFYSSHGNGERSVKGLKLTQTILSPTIEVPFRCMQDLSSLVDTGDIRNAIESLTWE